MSIHVALNRARRLHAAAMLDRATVTRNTRGPISETTGRHQVTAAAVYTGPVRLRPGSPSVVDQATIAATVTSTTIDLPWDGDGATGDPGCLLPGDVVELLTGPLTGQRLRITAAVTATTSTCWRYQVEVVA